MPAAYIGAASAVINTVSSLAGGSSASGDISAGQQQANAALKPYEDTGNLANTQTANLLGLNGQDSADTAMKSFQSAPGYQYNVQQGLLGVDSGAASKGLLRSGATLQAEQTLGSNLANQNYQQYIGNLNQLAGNGLQAATGTANVDTGAATNQAKIDSTTANNVGNSLSGLANNPSTQNALSSIFGGSSSSSGQQASTGQAISQATTPTAYGPYIGGP